MSDQPSRPPSPPSTAGPNDPANSADVAAGADPAAAAETVRRIREQIGRAVVGQEEVVGQVMAALPDRVPPELLETFVLDEQDPMRAGRVYLVDPLGNLMMSYQPEDEPSGMIKDLERLLKYSGLG